MELLFESWTFELCGRRRRNCGEYLEAAPAGSDDDLFSTWPNHKSFPVDRIANKVSSFYALSNSKKSPLLRISFVREKESVSEWRRIECLRLRCLAHESVHNRRDRGNEAVEASGGITNGKIISVIISFYCYILWWWCSFNVLKIYCLCLSVKRYMNIIFRSQKRGRKREKLVKNLIWKWNLFFLMSNNPSDNYNNSYNNNQLIITIIMTPVKNKNKRKEDKEEYNKC